MPHHQYKVWFDSDITEEDSCVARMTPSINVLKLEFKVTKVKKHVKVHTFAIWSGCLNPIITKIWAEMCSKKSRVAPLSINLIIVIEVKTSFSKLEFLLKHLFLFKEAFKGLKCVKIFCFVTIILYVCK